MLVAPPGASSARVGGVNVPVAGVGATCTLPLSSWLTLGGADLRWIRSGVRSAMELIAPTTAVVAAMLNKMVE